MTYPRLDRRAPIRARVGYSLSRAIGVVSRAWRRRGLGRAYSYLQRLGALGLPTAVVEYEPDCRMRLPVFEPYWAPTIIGGRPYEPDVAAIFDRFRALDPVFVDGGANYGYWSITLSGPRYRWRTVVAVEASPWCFEVLRENARLNRDRFRCVHGAIDERLDRALSLRKADDPARHAVVRVLAESTDHDAVTVGSVTIDRIVGDLGAEAVDRPVLLKLDVEGAEIPALLGASGTRTRDHAVVYEDWARKDVPTTRFLLSEGYRIYRVDAAGVCRRIADAHEIVRDAENAGRLRAPHNLLAVRADGVFATVARRWSEEDGGPV